MLVDLFCDTVVLDAQQGTEKDRIFKEVYEIYTQKITDIYALSLDYDKHAGMDDFFTQIFGIIKLPHS